MKIRIKYHNLLTQEDKTIEVDLEGDLVSDYHHAFFTLRGNFEQPEQEVKREENFFIKLQKKLIEENKFTEEDWIDFITMINI